jgi:predicted amidohydrolase
MRNIRIAGAQLGPVQKADSRQAVVARMLDLMRQAKAAGCDLIVYPACTELRSSPGSTAPCRSWSSCRCV